VLPPVLRLRREAKRRLQAGIRVLALGCLTVLLLAPAAAATPTLVFSSLTGVDPEPLSAVSCPSESLCVAVDRGGQAVASTSPGSGTGWVRSPIGGAGALSAVSCPTSSLCVAVDESGRAFETLDPGPFAGWSSQAIDATGHLRGVSCTAVPLCVAVDDAGIALVTTNPGPGAVWSPAEIDPHNKLRGVSCTGASSCVAVDEAGDVLATENPFAGWHRPRALGGVLSAVSCYPGGCVLSDGNGNALASADPWSEPATWSTTPITGSRATAASCTSAGLCVVVDEGSAAFASQRATSGLPEWSAAVTAAGVSMSGVSCLPGGLCVAVDSAGQVVSLHVPRPEAATVQPQEVTQSTATLAGVVNPNGGALTGCRFEYGTTSGYGSVAPCAAPPSATGGAQTVTAHLSGLEGNTTYHYRVQASNAGGTEAGADQTFTTAATSGVPLVFPHPSLTGTPAIGQRLTCHTGISSGTTARISYAWLRDLIPIPNATASSYVVRGGDAGFHIQCQVTAADAGGDASAKSGFVTIPIEGIPAAVGETRVSRAQVRGTKVSVPVHCSVEAGGGCQVVARLTVVETLSGGRVIGVSAAGPARGRRGARAAVQRRTVTIAGVRAHLARGQRSTLTLTLNRSGRALLARRRSLPATLTVSGTVIGVLQASLSRERIVLGVSSGHGRGH
jgi:hypothetical protein